jgi:hypothetical protein
MTAISSSGCEVNHIVAMTWKMKKKKNFRWCRSLALYSAAHFSSLPYLMAKLFFRIKNKKEKKFRSGWSDSFNIFKTTFPFSLL